jgi:guanosine-3',5'-bis(diphosphate) 3'-pyrophosphohydrolase
MNMMYKAMSFAFEVHRNQVRKYTGNAYTDHLAEVVGITASFVDKSIYDIAIPIAWLHDCIEDQNVAYSTLVNEFGNEIADGVLLLSDLESGNREERKLATRQRLNKAPGYIQTIKIADIISNVKSIKTFDPKFYLLFKEEIKDLLDILTLANSQMKRFLIKIY